jgi:hypothetical protein
VVGAVRNVVGAEKLIALEPPGATTTAESSPGPMHAQISQSSSDSVFRIVHEVKQRDSQ